MPQLLIACEYPTLLGGERSMLATLGAVAAAGFDVQVAVPPNGPLADALKSQAVRHVPWQTHDDSGVRLPLEQLRADLTDLVTEVQPDLLHANSLSTARIAGPVCVRSGVRSIGHFRDIVKLSPQVVADLNVHDQLIAVSRATRDFHVAQGIDAPRCVVVHNGVDLELFRPRPRTGFLHRELNLSPDVRLVATIGQLGLRKGTDTALGAAWNVAEEVTDVHWLIVGERTSTKQESHEFDSLLHTRAESVPLAGRVHFLGVREDVAELLPECDLLMHAARQEPLGRVLLEAAACGLAIVATDVGGTREIFPEGEAILVRPDDSTQLANETIALLRDNDLRISLGQSARRRAENAFDVQQAAERLIEQYQRTLRETH